MAVPLQNEGAELKHLRGGEYSRCWPIVEIEPLRWWGLPADVALRLYCSRHRFLKSQLPQVISPQSDAQVSLTTSFADAAFCGTGCEA